LPTAVVGYADANPPYIEYIDYRFHNHPYPFHISTEKKGGQAYLYFNLHLGPSKPPLSSLRLGLPQGLASRRYLVIRNKVNLAPFPL